MLIDLQPPLRTATPDDAFVITELANIAGEGLPLYVWSRMAAPGDSPWDIGRERARRAGGAFSYRNAVILEEEGEVAACLIGYPIDDQPQPTNYAELPAMFVPLQELEDMAPGTWYVNVLATYPACRGKGYGTRLLAVAEQLARETNKRGMSIIVSDANTAARRLYERAGYREHATRPMVKDGWKGNGSHWVLLLKPGIGSR